MNQHPAYSSCVSSCPLAQGPDKTELVNKYLNSLDKQVAFEGKARRLENKELRARAWKAVNDNGDNPRGLGFLVFILFSPTFWSVIFQIVSWWFNQHKLRQS